MAMTIQQLQAYNQQRDHAPAGDSMEQRLACLLEEVREVMEQARSLEDEDTGEVRARLGKRLGMEIYDVMATLCALANRFDIDLEQAFTHRMLFNELRTGADQLAG